MQANVDAYAEYYEQLQDAYKAIEETGSEELSDYVMEVVEPTLEAGELSTEEILAEVEVLKQRIQEARVAAVEEGRECSTMISWISLRDGKEILLWAHLPSEDRLRDLV